MTYRTRTSTCTEPMPNRPLDMLHDAIAETFGADGHVVSGAVGSLYHALEDHEVPDEWKRLFGFSDNTLSKRQQKRLAALLGDIDQAPEQGRLFFALHTYLSLVLGLTARRAVGCLGDGEHALVDRQTLVELGSGEALVAGVGVTLADADDPFGWYVDSGLGEALEAARAIDDALGRLDDAVFLDAIGRGRDVFKVLYEALIPRTVRRSLGEHYTPGWLATHLVDQLLAAQGGDVVGRALDPSCGSGTFLLELVRRRRRARPGASAGELLAAVTGFDLNPLAVRAARANLLLCVLDRGFESDSAVELPVFRRDALDGPSPGASFDAVVGNPPWINWQGLPDEKRAELQPLWEDYGLFVHEGFDTILGKGKKEFATVFTAAVVDRYLRDGGRIAFVITQGVWKAAGASEGFRRLDFGGAFELAVERVEDLSAFKVFDSATTRTTTFVAQKGSPVEFPVDYVYWRRRGRRARLDSTGTFDDALDHADRIELAAEPYSEVAPESPWITARPAAIRAIRRLFGDSAYQARQGVNTGGGNAIFWMRVLQRTTLGGARVENILKGAKKKVEQVQAELESDHLYPLVRGRDISRWHARGDRHILMVQDPERRRGIAPDTLQADAPRTLAYLERFEDQLRSRSLFRRYFTRGGEPTAPWWSMFGVGEYTFLPWKVVWAGQVATHLDCAVVGPDGGQLTMPDQTAYYVGLDTEAQADFLCGLLNAAPIRLLYRSFLYKHVSLSFIEALDLPEFDADVAWMSELAGVAREARIAAADGREADACEAEARADAIACEYWGIRDEERADVTRSLERLQ